MRAIWLAVLAFGLVKGGFAAETPPPFSGKFTVHYVPVYCVRAPCPEGSYAIWAEDRALGSADSVKIDPETAAEVAKNIAGAWAPEGIAVEGDLRFGPEAGVAHIRADRAFIGVWKTELPPPETDAKGKAPATLVVVNKTRDVVRGIYVSPASADHWGKDVLRSNLAIRQRVSIDLPTDDCLYDVRILLGVRPAEEIRRIDVCRSPTLEADRSGLIIDRAR